MTKAGLLRVGFGFALLWLAASAMAQEPSLAEQAARARSRSGQSLSSDVMGRTVNGNYLSQLRF